MTLTHHGRHIPGTTDKDEPVKYRIVDCAGIDECQPCVQDVKKAWTPEMIAERGKTEKNLEREDIQVGKLDINSLAKKPSAVVHPAHYNMYDGIEIIDLAEQMNFNKGNALKYITRAEFKGKEIEDLEKARYYLKKEIKRIKRNSKKKLKKRRGGGLTGPVIIDEIHNFPGFGGPNGVNPLSNIQHNWASPTVTNVYNNG